MRKPYGQSEVFVKNNPYETVYPFPTPCGVILEKNVYATMRDGIKLAMDVYKPANEDGPSKHNLLCLYD